MPVDTVFRKIGPLLAKVFFLDAARPVEWISILALVGWVELLLRQPELFAGVNYRAFSALPPHVWAAVILAVVSVQISCLRPSVMAPILRFGAMSFAAGLWTLIALTFWETGNTPLFARTTTAIALSTAATGVWLGWTSRSY